ncbi:HipA domain-containing protein [Shewanella sp. GXUN23E]|uniref:HipA domain-containing protein n=1 Tax=Shewanella sp. GXUN23E TaxID=3422498 RepID=UPI003D7ECF64
MHLGDRVIGELTFEPDSERFAVSYRPDWQDHGFPVSPMIPLDGSGKSSQIAMFLVNLLPENRGLDYLIESLGVSRGNTFALIKAIGLDTAGAIAFVPAGEAIPPTEFRPITDAEVIKRLEDPQHWPMEVWDGKPRLSVAGVQPKLNLFFDGKVFGFGEGDLCSTHILKFEKHRHLIINEFLTMRLAKAIGMKVAEVEVVQFGEHKALCVERFDRRYVSTQNRVLRRHMVDACQALGFSVNKKYERNLGSGRDVRDIREGVSFQRLFGLADSCVTPIAARVDMLRWALFNLLTGNSDAHGKNYSFFMTPDGLEPTPWYDLVNIALYEEFEQDMAMAIDDEFNPNKVFAYQLAAFAEELSLPRALLIENLANMANGIRAHLDRVIDMLAQPNADEQAFIAEYRRQVLASCDKYLAMLADIRTTSV